MATVQKELLQERVVPFTADDGFTLHLIHVRGAEPSTKGPVLLVHGAGVRANIFRPPVEKNFVEYLVEHGYDVWLENWRGSIDVRPNYWNLDQAALYDHPAAVRTVLGQTGAKTLKAVIHCQGSTSFTMSAVAGLVPQVQTIVSNAVSLHPVVPRFSKFKLKFTFPLIKPLTDHLNPQWGLKAPSFAAKLINGLVLLTHHECDNAVCRHVSFSYGSGFPALWRHENLNEATHDWLQHEFAFVPLTFYAQIARCIQKGRLLAMNTNEKLPEDFTARPPKTSARFAFFAGEKNLCFLPESQERTFDFFNRFRKEYHSLHLLAGYGHLDVFMGKNAADDVFPLMLAELDKTNDEN